MSAVPETRPAVTAAELWARAEPELESIDAEAARRESERELPHEPVRALARAGLGSWRVPAEFGGAGVSVREAIEFVLALAAADSNIAQAVRPHFGFVESLRTSPASAERDRWFGRVADGDLMGLAHGEIGAPNGVIRTRLTRDGEHWRLNGSKFYSTGTLFADWVSVSALDDDENLVSVVLPTDREGLVLVDDWDAIGQRLTASGTTELHGVHVSAEDFRDKVSTAGRRSLVTAFQQLFLGAVEAGIAQNALSDAVSYAQEKSRPIKHSQATRSVDDPYIQHAVGEISARAYVARAAILLAADAIDRAHREDATPADLTTAAVEVAQAQFVAVESALKASELIFDVGGGSTALRRHNLDRHWRNARTVANHNPRYYKAGVVGAHRLTGAEPPTTGLF